MIGLSEKEVYIEDTECAAEPLQRQGSQPTQSGSRSTSPMHEAPAEEVENAHCRRLRLENESALHPAADAENITPSQCLCRKDETAWRMAATIKQSSQVLPASAAPTPAPPSGSPVTRCHGKTSTEVLTASQADPFTYTEAMERPQRDHWKSAMEDES
jgi:hypothetical protein